MKKSNLLVWLVPAISVKAWLRSGRPPWTPFFVYDASGPSTSMKTATNGVAPSASECGGIPQPPGGGGGGGSLPGGSGGEFHVNPGNPIQSALPVTKFRFCGSCSVTTSSGSSGGGGGGGPPDPVHVPGGVQPCHPGRVMPTPGSEMT